ncbi:hypothetical protein PSU4_36130 [Pseudonocardia sulfidoxydans NBRC 16205]|uniref:MucB/RseB N-terminal domain-containing protein n=1 Tax=Pseudonocardia sulfidoxydans NBRC 16205 TaxID=1223511 RepID=A0A511DIM4_9PSEU|nr:hypothetical protein PSU4_36130 [Pseudonocardia sulfidoxydans NBRC 16205]
MSRRALLVGAGAAALVAAGTVPWPAGATGAPDPAALRARIRASAAQPYTGFAEASGRLGLPDLPQLGQAIALFTGTTRIRVFHAGPQRWRVDELTAAGERDIYHLDGVESSWDFGSQRLTRIVGTTSVRLPRAADLLPPDLARRILAAAPDDPVEALPDRRVAGRAAAGIRVTPADPDTTVAHVDVWADATSGLPLRVEITGRADPGRPVLTSELTSVDLTAPADDVLVPTVPPGATAAEVPAADLAGALRVLGPSAPPGELAGRGRLPRFPDLPGIGVYGTGLGGFVLVPVTGRIAAQAVDGAAAAGGVPVTVPTGRAVAVSTPLLSVVIRAGGRRGALLVGTVSPAVLARAVTELAGAAR